MDIVQKASESETLVSFVDGVLGLVPVVGTMVSQVISSWVDKNKNCARDVLLSQVRAGDIEAIQKDEFLSMLYRFYRSVQEGAGKKNLILLARLISGIGRVDKENSKAQTFNEYTGLLESLNYNEIEFLALFIKNIPETYNNQYDEIKQSLLYKGFLTSEVKSSVIQTREIVTGPPIANSAMSAAMQNKTINVPAPFDVKTITEYKTSKKLQFILERYGNLWGNIADDQ